MRTTQGTRPETATFKDRLIIERAAQTLEQITRSDENTVLFRRNAFTPSKGKIRPLTERSHTVFVAREWAVSGAGSTIDWDDKSSCRFNLYCGFKGNLYMNSCQKVQRGSHSAVLVTGMEKYCHEFGEFLLLSAFLRPKLLQQNCLCEKVLIKGKSCVDRLKVSFKPSVQKCCGDHMRDYDHSSHFLVMKVWMDVFYVKRVQQHHYAKRNVNIIPNRLVADSQIKTHFSNML